MSRTIDEKVVEMRFDNSQFESNVQTSLSTLDKLKKGLDLDGAAKGLEGLGDAAKKCNLSTLGNSVETVRAKFSALEVMAVAALANITNSAVNAGKRLISTFAIEPITTGFNEYELKMGSVQTIMASTGESLDKVNQKLDELNAYSDRTIYSFSDMTTNIGKFTNAGVKLDDAVASIQGISNVAALSGANANEASRAMYNFAQALSSGSVRLADWKSIELANMATVEFKNQLLESAVAAGTLEKTAGGMYKVLSTNNTGGTMQEAIDATHMFNDSLSYQWMTTEVLTSTLKDYADETTDIGKRAFAAAQDVKTFSQLMDTLKESAQSGWAETWQLIVGDYDEAKGTLREFSEFFSNVIDSSSDARNALLGGALMSSWGQLKNKVGEAGISVDDFKQTLQETASESVVGFDKMVEEAGSFDATLSKGWLTTDILAKTLDNLVNEATGTTKGIAGLSDEQLKNVGYTEQQIQALRSLSEQANTSGSDIESLVQNMTRKSGRELLFDSLLNACKALAKLFGTLKQAWSEVFPPVTSENLYGIINAIHQFSQKLIMSDETADKVKRTFKGFYAVLDIVCQGISAVASELSPLFGVLGTLASGILSVTASFGDWLVGIDEAVKKGGVFSAVCQGISGFIQAVISLIKGFVKAIGDKFNIPGMETLHSFLERIQERMGSVVGAANGMQSGVSSAIKGMGASLSNSAFLQALQNLYNGIKTVAAAIVGAIGGLASEITEKLADADFSGLIDLLNGVSLSAIAVGITKFLNSVKQPFDEVGGLLDNVKSILDGVRGCFEAYQTQLNAGSLLKIAGAIAVLAAAIVAISLIDSNKLAASLGAITVLFADLMGSMAIFTRISGDIKGVLKTCTAMIAVSTAVLILASALKKVADLDMGQLAVALTGVIALMASLVGASKILGSGSKSVIKGATQMVIFASAIKLLASVCTDLSNLDWSGLAKGLTGVGVLMAEVSLFMNTAKFSGKSLTTATGIIVLASAIKVLASACKDFGEMSLGGIAKGLSSVGVLLLEVAAFTKLTGDAKHVISTGLALIEIAAAMKIFASVMSAFGGMSWEQVAKGLLAFGAALTEVAVAVNFMPKNMVSLGVGLIAVGTALKIVGEALRDMGSMSWEEIAKGLVLMGGALAELAIGLNLMNGTLAGSAALLVAAGAIAIFTPALALLGAMSWESIAKGLIALAGAFTIVGVAGALLTPLVPSILGLSAAIALIGVGTLAAGAGLTAIAVGITALATALGAGVTIIVAGLTSIITGIAALIPAIGEAIKAIVLTLVDVLVECVPSLANGALELISGVLSALVSYTPQIVESIMQFLISVLEGVAQNLPALISAVADVLMALFSGVVNALSGIDTGTLLQGIAAVGLLSAIMVALGAVAGLIPAAMLGVLGMGAVIAELALVLAAIGALAQLPGLSWLIGEGGMLLQNIGTAIGSFIGGIVGGVMGGISSQLPQIGADLSAFITSIQPFIDGASSISPNMLSGVQTLSSVILQLTAADILNGLTSWLTGGTPLSSFAEQFVPFGQAMSNFSAAISGVDVGMVANVTTATTALTQMAATIPNVGGLVSFFTGENSIDQFGTQLVSFGNSLKAYSMSVQGLDASAISNSATASTALVQLANTIPNCGGLVSFFAGDNSIDQFGTQLVSFGRDLSAYSNAIKNVKPDVVTASANAASALSNLASGLPDKGVFAQWFGGDQTLASFGEDIAAFGDAMGHYYSKVSGADPGKLSGVIEQVWSLVDLAKGLKGIDKNAFSNFSESLTALGNSGIDGFVNAFSNGGQKVNAAINAMLNSISSAISKGKSTIKPSMEGIMASLAEAVTSKSPAVAKAMEQLMKQLSSTISNKANSIRSSMRSVLSSAVSAINGTRGSFVSAGVNVAQGFVSGINSRLGSASAAGRSLGLAALNAAKRALDSHSPSREFIHLGQNMGEGLAIGVKNSIVSATSATSKMIGEVIKVSQKGLDAFEKWIEEKKYYGELSLKDELAGWENLQKKYTAGSEERMKIDREVYRVQNELVSATYQASMDWIEREKYYNRLSLKQELEAYGRVQKRYLQGSEERIKADREVYRLRNELVDASYQHSMNWIEEEKYYSRMGLADELAAYKRVQSRYYKGTEERKKMDREVFRLEKEISAAQKKYAEDVQKVQNDAIKKRTELEEEYADKVKSVNERLAQDIKSLNDQYQSSLESRMDTLYRSYGLFDEVKEREEVSGESLMNNLEAQVKEFNSWQDTLDKLSARRVDSGLMDELREMGPASIAQIKALNSMTDSELEKYVSLWSLKHGQAHEQAVSELEGLREETQKNIAQLRDEADKELEEYREIWLTNMSQVTEDANAELEKLRIDFGKKIGYIKNYTEDELKDMTETSRKILRNAGWDDTGQKIVTGLTAGVTSQKPNFISALVSVAVGGVKAVKNVLGIKSPSRVFMELGNYSGLGFVKGLNSYVDKSYDIGSEMAESAKSGLSDAIQTVADIVDNGIDTEPTIRPVLDLSNMSKGADELYGLLNTQQAFGLAGQVSWAFNSAANYEAPTVVLDNDDIVQEIRSLRSDISELSERTGRLKVVMDTGVLVGEIAEPIDSVLGQKAAYKVRGI